MPNALTLCHSEPGRWLLCQDNETKALYLLSVCEQSAAVFLLLLELDATENEEYRALGMTFLNYLAEKVAYWPSRFRTRAIHDERLAAATVLMQ